MKQLLNAKHTEILIGLLTMGVALVMFLSRDYTYNPICVLILPLQFISTCVLLFGILKAHKQHKPKLMLFWLLTTPALFFGLIYYGISRWLYWNILFSVITVSICWSAAIAVLYMLIIMYNHYVELTLGPIEVVAPPPETELTKEELAALNGQV